MAKEYHKLNKVSDYDHEAAEELAEALNEINQNNERNRTLRALVDENSDLHPFVWQTAEGVVIPLHKIEDDHLANIMAHILERGQQIPKSIRSEAVSRNIAIPAKKASVWDRAKLIESDRLDVGY